MMKILFLFFALISLGAHAKVDILQIGDSQSAGIFGKIWHSWMRDQGHKSFHLVARGGSTTESWMDYSKLAGKFRRLDGRGKVSYVEQNKMSSLVDLLVEASPRTLIIQLGGNMVRWDDEFLSTSLANFFTLLDGHSNKCLWIAPPHGHARPEPRFSAFYPILKSLVEWHGCHLIDSRPYTFYPPGKGDGIHFDSLGFEGRRLVKKWVKGLYQEMGPLL
jgi:hypothetical protein